MRNFYEFPLALGV
jgi:hypothetical protein